LAVKLRFPCAATTPKLKANDREFAMPQAAAPTVESALAPDHIDATLNYIIDDGSEVFTIVAGPGGTDTRSGGTADPRRVTIHNGRPHAKDFVLERHGFRFVCHDTKVEDFYDEDQIRRWKR
jgi:hypothetical protein